MYADSAYSGANQKEAISKKEMNNQVHEKVNRAHPMTEEQKLSNIEKSRTRARVEHVFGFMEMNMNAIYLNCIGFKRTNTIVGLLNLTYNMFRKIQLQSI